MRLLTLFLIASFSSTFCFAQEVDHRFENFTIEEGLPHNLVLDIMQDDLGVIWFWTEGGLARYDGYGFESYHLKDNKFPSVIPKGNEHSSTFLNNQIFFHNNKEALLFDPVQESTKPLTIDLGKNWTSYTAKDSCIWLGTQHRGLLHYSKDFELREIIDETNCRGFPSGKQIKSVYEDFSGNIWINISADTVTLYKINPIEKTIKGYPCLKEEHGEILGLSDTINSAGVRSFLQLTPEELWIATNNGLVLFNYQTEKFLHYRYTKFNVNHTYAGAIDCMFFYKNQLWCGTSEIGVMIFDLSTKKFIKNYRHDPLDKNSLMEGHIHEFYYSKKFEDGVLWIATSNGLSKVDLEQKAFKTYRGKPNNQQAVSITNVRSVYADKNTIWIGNGGNGNNVLDIVNKHTGVVSTFNFDPDNPQTLGKGAVGSIVKRPDGKFWISSWSGWLNLYDPATQNIKRWKAFHNDIGLNSWALAEAEVDQKGNYWISSIGGGLLKIIRGSQKIDTTYYLPNEKNSEGFPNHTIRDIYLDLKSIDELLWLGIDNGFASFNPKNENFKYYPQNRKLPCDVVSAIYRDKDGIFWLGMDGCGLVRLDINTNDVQHWTVEDGLPSNIILSVYEDENGRLWMSTSNGISVFDREHQSFKNYSKENGLPGNQFNWGAHFQDESGNIYFGGLNGLTVFQPSAIKDNPYAPEVILTDLYLKGEKIAIGDTINGEVILTENISTTKNIQISHLNNDFSIAFAAIHFATPSQNKFQYKLEGYDEHWRTTGASNREATYANLPAGTYQFIVRAGNPDGKWGNPKQNLTIEILPPWWRTWWFRGLLIISIFTIVYAFIKWRTFSLLQQRKELENQVALKTSELKKSNDILKKQREEILVRNDFLKEKNEKIEGISQKLQEAIQIRTNFFTNISHEFRTPLTLIIGPLSNVFNNEKMPLSKVKAQTTIAYRNAKRLLRLINQLLDISELDAGVMKLRITEGELVEFCQSIVNAFEYRAKKTSISLDFKSTAPVINGYFDEDKIEKALYNLISNAFKFTEAHGKVRMELHMADEKGLKDFGFANICPGRNAVLIVKDTGIGIPQEQQQKIFDRFHKVEDKERRKMGTGIGLALSKQLIEVHKGEIIVKSEEGFGTQFSFFIPIDKTQYHSDEVEVLPSKIEQRIKDIEVLDREITTDEESFHHDSGKEKPTLLIAEDSSDMRLFLKSNLEQHFKIILAEDGQKAYEKAIDTIPDFIISDLMMPQLNGYGLCEKLREHENTSHIPFILLTAKNDEEAEIKGFHAGADDYITKPFSVEILHLKVSKLLSLKQASKDKFQNETEINSDEFTRSPIDKAFLEKALKIVEENYQNSGFGADQFCELMAMSKPVIYRKLKSITGQTLNEFLRVERLKKAKVLLKTSSYNISEIAINCGFNSLEYFVKSFKKKYGKTPKQFREVS
ncbi:hybrid sensor histidine kinase/response regulator transcription factor [Flexithrix dorotheae]|uniref:hybrid sensor histidine kinase/response regulator transcription factor n=1 Tax=Flexithrix dorotheae TaxID=70993 RepID=UPI0003774066|nr:hybrid sensor histidine kinase/response regulator transcription factor [Flexithrix dorotheae]